MNDMIKEYVYTNKERLLSMIYELVAVQSVKGDPSEGAPFGIGPRAALDKMVGICRREGFESRICDDVVGIADISVGDGFPALGILCHLDVVPAADQDGWLTDPFKMIEKDGIIYGRGVIDDKGPLAAVFMAMKCIQTLKIPLKKGVRLIFGTDEENGSEDLKIYKANNRLPDNVFTPDGAFPVINIEKGLMRSVFTGSYKGGNVLSFHGGSIPNAVPDTAECVIKNIPVHIITHEASEDRSGARFDVEESGNTVTIRCKGVSAHASTPETGINAVTALIALLCRLPIIDGPQKNILSGLSEIFPHGETSGEKCKLKCSDERSGELTLVFSIFNMENGKCSGTVDVRFPVCMSLAQVEAAEKAALLKAGCDFSGYSGDEPHITDENSEFVQKLLKVYERCEGEKGRCIAVGGGTYVHDIPGGVAFGVERNNTDYHMHGANEFITVDELLNDAIVFTEAIIEICG